MDPDVLKPEVSRDTHRNTIFEDVVKAKETEKAINYDAKVAEHPTKDCPKETDTTKRGEPAYPGSIL